MTGLARGNILRRLPGVDGLTLCGKLELRINFGKPKLLALCPPVRHNLCRIDVRRGGVKPGAVSEWTTSI